ncbi:ATP-grasp domain-containing protein [Mucilaginibacter sp. McL0603]|uniref:ATP-grasp domain-containing protein n=1 Tax=Mucilaginibacter sp. McL0603 TaxID=3415670 RepID=UPI003CF9FF4B
MALSAQPKLNFGSSFRAFAISISKVGFFTFEKARAYLFPVPGIRILFSANEGFEKNIRRGFLFLRYEIHFDGFAAENIRKGDLLVPLNVNDVRVASKMAHLTGDRRIPLPVLEAINICDDKYLFNKTLVEKGFKDIVPKISNNLPTPYFLKKKVDLGGRNSHLILNAEAEAKFKDMINSPDYFRQEIVEGKSEYATHILFRDHRIVTTLTIKHTFPKRLPVNGIDKSVYSTISNCAYLDTFSSVLEAIGFEGLCCFDYKVVDGKLYIFEINPRFGGSLGPYFFTFLRRLKVNAA